MQNHAILESIVDEQRVSLVVAGEERKVDALRAMLKMINSNIICNKTLSGKGCKLTVHIPSMGVEAMRQRTVQTLAQGGFDIQPLQPQQINENPPDS